MKAAVVILVLSVLTSCVTTATSGLVSGGAKVLPRTPDYTGRTFPGGRTKALILSFDDGWDSDRELVALLNKYGIRGTFNLVGDREEGLGDYPEPERIAAGEIKTLYDGHALGVHTARHSKFEEQLPEEILPAILTNKERLEELTGRPVRVMVPPHGTATQEALEIAAGLGILASFEYGDTGNFALPKDWMRWRPTVHHSGAPGLVEDFLEAPGDDLRLFSLWGHSWELRDVQPVWVKGPRQPWNSWVHLESLLKSLSGRTDVWYTTVEEVARWALEG